MKGKFVKITYTMKKIVSFGLLLLPFAINAQEISEPLIIPELYTWKLSPNGKWLSGGSREECNVYNMESHLLETYPGARYGTITDNGVLATSVMGKPALLINGEAVVPESLEGASGGYIQCISTSGNRLSGNLNYPELGINGLFVCDIDENGVVGAPKPLPRPSEDLFGCEPQFVNVLVISDDGSTITGFVQDWRGYYSYPIIFSLDTQGEWTYSLPTESLFNPNKYPIPENPWLDEPEYPLFTDFMTSLARIAYDEAIENFYAGLLPDYPDAKDFMTEEQWNAYYEAALTYNDWYYGHEEAFKAYDRDYDKIIFSSVNFDLNEVSINPDGSYIGCSYSEYRDELEITGVIKINTRTPEFQKFESDIFELYISQILSDGTILMTQPMMDTPGTCIILPEKNEITDIKDYFKEAHPDYLAWMNENLDNIGSIYTNDDMSIFAGSVLAIDCEKVEQITGGYFSFTYVFSPGLAAVESIDSEKSDRYIVFSIQGIKIMETDKIEDLKNLPKGIYIINGKTVNLL